MPELGGCTCCNRALIRRSSGSGRRAALVRRYRTFTLFSACAYGLKGETERAVGELAEAQRLSPDDRYSSIARLRSAGLDGSGSWGVPKICALNEATYFAGLRKAGMPEE